jgi:hypothetical protein
MYESHETIYGGQIRFPGLHPARRVATFLSGSGQLMRRLQKSFGILMDMRGMYPLPPEAAKLMKRNMERAKRAGMGRSAQIVDDAITAMQFKRLAREVGISDTTLPIDSSSVSDCERVAVDWIVEGIELDKQ